MPPGDLVQIVVTPGSGDGRAEAVARDLEHALRARGQAVRLSRFDDLYALARWGASCAAGFARLVSVGGDATMSAAAAAAVRHRVPLLPVPCGFGNLFARTFGHAGDAESAVQALDQDRVVWIDAGARHGGLFLSHESFGVLEDIQSSVEQEGVQPRSWLLRLLAYYRMGIRCIGSTAPRSIGVEVDGVVVARRAALVTIANVRAYGDFLTLTPDASPMDGLLDVFVIPSVTRLGLWRPLLKLLLRVRPRRDEVLVRRGRRVSVRLPGRRREDIEVLAGVLPVLVAAGWVERQATTQRSASAGHVAA